MFERLKHSFRDLIVLIKRPEMAILPGHLAFYMVLSIVPMFLILIILASSFSVSSEVIANFLGNSVPSEVNEILSSVILRAKIDFNVQLFLLLSIYIASSGLYSVIVSANTLYHNDMKNFWIRKLKSLFLTILFVFLFLFIIIIMAFGNSIIQYFENVVNNDLIWNYINYVYFIARWPFAFIYIYIVVNLIYTLAPDNHIKGKSVIVGSVFTTVMWILVTFGYSFWVDNYTRYDLVYGSLSTMIVMMIWIYLLSYFFILGLAINANQYRRKMTRSEKNAKSNDDFL